jgi:peptide-methionine (S)-S-oxide reductase
MLTELLAFPAAALFAFAFGRSRSADQMAPAPLPPVPAGMQEATFAAGCFWGVEQAFKQLPGVLSTAVGYIGGDTENPTYRDVCYEDTRHAEAVRVIFDPAQITYEELLDAFWSCHDPTTKDRQGPDVGDQYRSAIFTHSPEQARLAHASLAEVDAQHVFRNPIVTEILPAETFWPAETYHQDYATKQGAACHTQGPAQVRTTLAGRAAATRQPR